MSFSISKIFISAFLIFGLTIAVGCTNSSQAPAPSQNNIPTPQESYLEHTIAYSGETLAEIALWYTGKASNWTQIREANPSIRPDRLRLGQVILIPQNIITNDKPFTRRPSKKKTSEVIENPTPKANSNPEPTATEAPSTDSPTPAPTEAPLAPVATAEPTVAPTIAPTPVPEAPTPQPNSKDLEREKLLDELLK
jgi:hypothetical protein